MIQIEHLLEKLGTKVVDFVEKVLNGVFGIIAKELVPSNSMPDMNVM